MKTIYSKQSELFCELMVEARKKAGLSQQQLADKLKKPQSFVAKYENGERRLDVVEFVVIAKLLGTSPEKIIKKII